MRKPGRAPARKTRAKSARSTARSQVRATRRRSIGKREPGGTASAERGRSSRSETTRTLRNLEALRAELERSTRADRIRRLNANPEDVQRSVARLVLTLVEFVRKLLERQALRRLEAGTLAPDQVEAIGLALMRLEETLREVARRFDLRPDELNLDLGPAGRLI